MSGADVTRAKGPAGRAAAGARRLLAPLLGIRLDASASPAPPLPAPGTQAQREGPGAAPPPVHPVPMPERIAAWRQGAPLPLALTGQVHARIGQRDVTFCVNIARDPIQNRHRAGQFYERVELDILLGLLPAGATVLDVGANTGNHALFLAMFAPVSRVIVIEPNPLAMEPLVGNVLANGLQAVIDIDHLGFGLGDADSEGWGMKRHTGNLGATRMHPGTGSLRVRRGDAAFPDLRPDLIKIDVEGMEMAVLAGLEGMIARARPLILVEVEAGHQPAFLDWARARGYAASTPGTKNDKKANFLLRPAPAAAMKE